MYKLDLVYEAVREIIPEGELYLVGGCVRDAKMDLTPKDYDFCTNLHPDRVEELAKQAGRHVYAIGKKFGTIGFKVQIEEVNKYEGEVCPMWHSRTKFEYIEVTTYRGEKYTEGSRKPEVVFSDSLMFDLSRRDFTMNAMAYGSADPSVDPTIVDVYASQLDILDKRIKGVGNCKDRFKEDPLRMLRAVRFAIQLGFELENNMYGIIKKMAPSIHDISRERWVAELDKMFSIDINKSIGLLHKVGLLEQILPELVEQGHLKHCVSIREDIDLRWRDMLGLVGEDAILDEDGEFIGFTRKYAKRGRMLKEGICHRLRFSNDRTKVILGGK